MIEKKKAIDKELIENGLSNQIGRNVSSLHQRKSDHGGQDATVRFPLIGNKRSPDTFGNANQLPDSEENTHAGPEGLTSCDQRNRDI